MVKRISFYTVLAAILIIIDRLSKIFILKLPDNTGVFESNYLSLKLLINPNLAFSLPLPNYLIIFLSALIIIALIYYLIKVIKVKLIYSIALILIITGASSNLFDRLKFGGVIDFISFSFWPTFNFADVYIIIGAIILLLALKNNYPPASKTDSAPVDKQEDSK